LAANSTQTEFSSRHDLATELVKLGIDPSTVEQLSIPTLGNLLTTLRRNLGVVQEKRKPGRPRGQTLSKNISSIDKKILKALLSSTGDVSSLSLSRELGIPLSTVQRRRKRLETYLLDMSYTLKVDKFGLRTADLFISTKNGMTDAVAKELLSLNAGIRSVSRVLGTSPADIMAAIVFKSNSDLLKIVERIKAIKGVGSISWVEVMASLGQNGNFSNMIIDGQ
jgi:DNA-binding Lrp family transcriptional regulator